MTSVREQDPAPMREAMVAELRQLNAITTDRVAAAFAAVPRHLFAGDEPLERVYHPDMPLVTKTAGDGTAISSLSAAHIQAVMLEQAEIQPGMRVLEVGSGGYNAALIAELVGLTGEVTTVDIDSDIVARAQAQLQAAGYPQVCIVRADAEYGVPDHAPFDLILVTVGAWDLPPAWVEQLVPTGRIVVPLRFAGITRLIAFDRSDTGLISHSYRLGGFVPMQGHGAHTESRIPVDEATALVFDGPAPDYDLPALRQSIRDPHIEFWPGVEFDYPDEIELFQVTHVEPLMPVMYADAALVDQGVLGPSTQYGVHALIRGGSFAYRAKRAGAQPDTFEVGVYAHGPDAARVAEQYGQVLSGWSRYARRGAARIAYIPVGGTVPAGWHAAKRHGTVVVTWP